MSEQIYGELDAFFETGTEGVLWAVQQDGIEGYEGLHVLKDGDYLEVFNDNGSIRWEGKIDLDWQVGFQTSPLAGGEFGQQAALGYWVNGIQRGFVPDVWAQMFFDKPPCRLYRDEVELGIEQIAEIADE